MSTPGYVWINGAFVPAGKAAVPLSDRGLTLGLGVFDTMAARDGRPLDAAPHFRRLFHDCCTVLLCEPPVSAQQLEEITGELLRRCGLAGSFARVRTQITAGTAGGLFDRPDDPVIMVSAAPAAAPESLPAIKAIIVSDYPRIAGCALENCKRLDYTRAYLARQKAAAAGANEAIITNTQGHIACAATSNLFIVEHERLVTPPLSDGVLDGITRRKVIEAGGAREDSISRERLLQADAVILTNSIAGVRLVAEIEGKRFSSVLPDRLKTV